MPKGRKSESWKTEVRRHLSRDAKHNERSQKTEVRRQKSEDRRGLTLVQLSALSGLVVKQVRSRKTEVRRKSPVTRHQSHPQSLVTLRHQRKSPGTRMHPDFWLLAIACLGKAAFFAGLTRAFGSWHLLSAGGLVTSHLPVSGDWRFLPS